MIITEHTIRCHKKISHSYNILLISHSFKNSFLSLTKGHLAFLACLTIYLFLKSKCFHWYISDESIYYYLAWDLDWSHLPYRDFFYANPPLLLLLLKLGGILSGWGVAGLRAVPIFCLLLSGYAFYRILSPRLGQWVCVPLCLYWLSYDSLRASTHATGISESLAFLGIAFLLAFRRKPALAGLFLGLGLWTKTYAITGLPGLLVTLWLIEPDRKNAFRSAGWCIGITFLMVVLLVGLGTCVGGKAFWDMNVFYHLSKQSTDAGLMPVFGQVLVRNQGSLYVLALTALLWLTGIFFNRKALPAFEPSSQKPPSSGNLCAGLSPEGRFLIVGSVHFISVFVFLVLQSRIFDFYLLLFLPALAFLAGGFLGMALGRWGQQKRVIEQPVFFRSCLIGYTILCLVFLAHPMIPRHYRLFMRELVTYWQHEERNADDLEKWKDTLSGEDVVLAGDSGTAPLVALLSRQRLALGEADTNQMRFQGGYPPASVFIQELTDSGVQWLIVRGRRTSRGRFIAGGMFSLPEFKAYAQSGFSQVDRVLLEGDTEVRLMRAHGGLLKPDTTPW